MLTGDHLAVWGDPIGHSLSPSLHAAAYGVLGLDWTYGRREVNETGFAGALAELDPGWRGLSLTMPLKRVAFLASVRRDRRAQLTGAVNTMLLDPHGPRGFNTDVGGIVATLHDVALHDVPVARILGAGATATSALVALGELGTREALLVVRRPAAADALVELGRTLGIRVRVSTFDAPHPAVPLTVATLPGDVPFDAAITERLAAAGGTLFDVVYGTWPTALASAWQDRGQVALSGLAMLLHQALLQVRVFFSGDPDAALPDEGAVLAAMRRAIMGD